jgi:hypothetical protein
VAAASTATASAASKAAAHEAALPHLKLQMPMAGSTSILIPDTIGPSQSEESAIRAAVAVGGLISNNDYPLLAHCYKMTIDTLKSDFNQRKAQVVEVTTCSSPMDESWKAMDVAQAPEVDAEFLSKQLKLLARLGDQIY